MSYPRGPTLQSRHMPQALKKHLDSQVAGNDRPPYPKVDHYWFKVAQNYEPLALQADCKHRSRLAAHNLTMDSSTGEISYMHLGLFWDGLVTGLCPASVGCFFVVQKNLMPEGGRLPRKTHEGLLGRFRGFLGSAVALLGGCPPLAFVCRRLTMLSSWNDVKDTGHV